MQPFSFIRSANKQSAVATGSESGAKFIAGGTNLVDLMKSDIETPSTVIDINGLTDLQQVKKLSDGSVSIGALVRNSDLAYHATVKKNYPVLSQALLSGASPQLRNMATVGGNLLQRTRCPYFYDTAFACNKRSPGSGCSALNGYNRSHAILGTSNKCIATHPSDMCVALAILDASIAVEGKNGTRRIAFNDFHLLPGDTPEHETMLQPGELITAVIVPPPAFTSSYYLKVRDRASYEFALASAAVALDINNGSIRTARIALGGVGTKPWRAIKAEQLLTNTSANEKNFAAAATAALEEAKPYTHNAFKIELAKRTLVSALQVAGGII